jgi:hypothetical protein
MCFPRKAGLGRYNGTREQWQAAYQHARIRLRQGLEPDAKYSGIEWKAQLIVAHDRSDVIDPLTIDVQARLFSQRLIAELILEEA